MQEIFYLDKNNEDDVINFSIIKDIKTETQSLIGCNEKVYYLFVKQIRKRKLKKIKATENHIIEGMAYAAEKLIFPHDYTKLNDNPYNVINEITKFYYAPLYNKHLVQFALCELSLSVSTSIDFYIQCLNKIKTNNLPTNDIGLLINTLSQNLYAEFRMENNFYRKPIIDAYIFRIKKLLDKYKIFFYLRVPDIYKWLQNLLTSCSILKNKQNPFTYEKIIPITAIVSKLITNPNIIYNYIYNLGCPCIITENGSFTFQQKNLSNDIIYFSLYKNIIEYLALGNERESFCAFFKYCKYKNWNCSQNTFKNIKNNPNCFLADLAKRFKIPYYLH